MEAEAGRGLQASARSQVPAPRTAALLLALPGLSCFQVAVGADECRYRTCAFPTGSA